MAASNKWGLTLLPSLSQKIFSSLSEGIPRGVRAERDVEIASGHGFLARYIRLCQKERAISPEQNFPRRGKFCVPAKHNPSGDPLGRRKNFRPYDVPALRLLNFAMAFSMPSFMRHEAASRASAIAWVTLRLSFLLNGLKT